MTRCGCGGRVSVVLDGDTNEVLAVCEKCRKEGPRLPGPVLPLPVSKFVAEIDRLGDEAGKRWDAMQAGSAG